MDKTDPPTSFGIFKPVGHTVIAFDSPAALQAAMDELAAQGFAPADLVHYTPAEMIAQADAELPEASPLASLGYERTLVKVQRAQAVDGCSFLVVHAPDDESAERVVAVANRLGARSAQRYGRFVVEDVIPKA